MINTQVHRPDVIPDKGFAEETPSLLSQLIDFFVSLFSSIFGGKKATMDDLKESHSVQRKAPQDQAVQKTNKITQPKKQVKVANLSKSSSNTKLPNDEQIVQDAQKIKSEVLEKIAKLDTVGIIGQSELKELENWHSQIVEWASTKAVNYDVVHKELANPVKQLKNKLNARERFVELEESKNKVVEMTSEFKAIKPEHYVCGQFNETLKNLETKIKSFETLDMNVKGADRAVESFKDAVGALLLQIDRITEHKEESKAAPIKKQLPKIGMVARSTNATGLDPVDLMLKYGKVLNGAITVELKEKYNRDLEQVHPMDRGKLIGLTRKFKI